MSTELAGATRLLRDRLPGLKAVYLYGSIARGDARPESDVDIAVLASTSLEPMQRLEFATELARQLRREVDLVDLANADTVFRAQVVSGGRRLYCRDEEECEAYEDHAFASYAYLNDERRGILDDIGRRGRIHG